MRSYWFPPSQNDYESGMVAQELSYRCTLCSHSNGSDSLNNPEDVDQLDKLVVHQHPQDITGGVSPDLLLGVSIRKLSKRYGSLKQNPKMALTELSLNLHEGQITVLLGYNGAGKSTTMSILSGIIAPTSGYALIYGRDIRTNMVDIRKISGLCPQHNVLFEELTVDEHLWLYASLKGINSSEITSEIDKLLHDMDLPTKRDTKVKNLSGGMKRKLSVAITFLGDSKLIILDEPTANVDPQARRAIWDLLIKYKRGRTILVSTHYMDEAQLLGDQIAIIDQGNLVCSGDPVFLKSMYGDGYHLRLFKSLSENFDTKAVTDYLTSIIPEISMERDLECEVEYLLPTYETGVLQTFQTLFEGLDTCMGELGVEDYALRDTSMEEVFFKVCEGSKPVRNLPSVPSLSSISDSGCSTCQPANFSEVPQADPALEELKADKQIPVTVNNRIVYYANTNTTTGIASLDEALALKPLKGARLYLSQFAALFKKKMLETRRNLPILAAQIFVPILFMSIGMGMGAISEMTGELTALKLSTEQYLPYMKPPHLLNTIPVAMVHRDVFDSMLTQDAGPSAILDTFYLPSGIGADCLVQNARDRSPIQDLFYIYSDEETVFFEKYCEDHYDTKAASFGKSRFANNTLKQYLAVKNIPAINYTGGCMNTNQDLPCSGCGFQGKPYCAAQPEPLSIVDTVTMDRLVDVSNGHVGPQFQLDQSHKQADLRNRYGGFVFKDYLYAPGMIYEPPAGLELLSSKTQAKVFYNPQGYHSLPTYVNILNNAILRANLPGTMGDPSSFGITAINHPVRGGLMPSKNLIEHGNDIIVGMMALVAVSALPASFVLPLVAERGMKIKLMQFISGAHPVVYWTVNFLYDFLIGFFAICICIVIILLFDVHAYTKDYNTLALFFVLLSYLWATIPTMYFFSNQFREPGTAYVMLTVFNLFLGIICVLGVYMMDIFCSRNDIFINKVKDIQRFFYVVVPMYNVGHAFTYIAFNQFLNEFYESIGSFDKLQYPSDFLSRGIAMNMIEGVVAFILVLLREYNFFIGSKGDKEDEGFSSGLGGQRENEDIASERQRVLNKRRCNDSLRICGLTKKYKTIQMDSVTAVDNLTLGIPQGQIFGLVGVNGCGKTSIFRMLTGDSQPTKGNVYIGGTNVTTDASKAWKLIGYCPQFDAIFGRLTVEEHLRLFASLRGIPRQKIDSVVVWGLNRLDLMEYRSLEARDCSGGTRRKLSCALCLLGNPEIVFLDDPTAGMDPRSRRFLWNLIQDVNASGRTVILTSNSMEECEALCSRMAIMSQGALKCLGTMQQLKSRFADGYTITLRLKDGANHALAMEEIAAHLPNAHQFDQHYNIIQYEMPTRFVNLSFLFQYFESQSEKLGITDYSISQKTLESVFMNLARHEMLDTPTRPKTGNKLDILFCTQKPSTTSANDVDMVSSRC